VIPYQVRDRLQETMPFLPKPVIKKCFPNYTRT
jgi:hypothetical protein